MRRPARNQIHTTHPLIIDRESRKILVLVTSELLKQFVNTLTADYRVFSLEWGEFIARTYNADISETERLFSILYCVSEIYVKF